MLRIWIPLLVALSAPTSTVASPAPRSITGVPLPPRARLLDDGSYRVAQRYRSAVKFMERYLKRKHIAYKKIPTYQAKGILVTRFLSAAPASSWLAIHLYRQAGITHLYIVPRPRSSTKGTNHKEKAPTP